VLGEASDGAQLIALVASAAPDVIITDVKMPNVSGTEAVKILCAKYPGIRIIALTSFGEDQQIIEMIEAGAMGFLSKNIVHEELVSAINSVYQHNAYFSQSITERLSKIIAQKTTVRHHNASISFTEVEKQIIGLICKELTFELWIKLAPRVWPELSPMQRDICLKINKLRKIGLKNQNKAVLTNF
jgi:two-component system response regulator NreC